MQFCQKCKKLVLPKPGQKEIVCSCGNKIYLQPSSFSEKIEKKQDEKQVQENIETYPIIKARCQKCGNNEAQFWTLQTRAGDEAETQFYRCTKCKHTWKEY